MKLYIYLLVSLVMLIASRLISHYVPYHRQPADFTLCPVRSMEHRTVCAGIHSVGNICLEM